MLTTQEATMAAKNLDVFQIKEALAAGGALPFFQPILSESWDGVGYEALGRLVVNGDTLAPAQFLPILESAGLLPEFDQCITAKAIRQIADWRESCEVPLRLNVNASPETLRNGTFVSFIGQCLRDNGFPSALLTVELMETCSFWRDKDILATLRGLQSLGVNLAIDDFPEWEESTALLEWLGRETIRVRTLKLDRSVVRRACGRDLDSPYELSELHRARDEVSGYVRFADEHSLALVAEGVEDERDRMILTRLGIGTFQGFGLGRPQPAMQAYHLRQLTTSVVSVPQRTSVRALRFARVA